MHFSGGQSGAKRKPDQSPPYPGSGRTQAEPGPDRARKRKAETDVGGKMVVTKKLLLDKKAAEAETKTKAEVKAKTKEACEPIS